MKKTYVRDLVRGDKIYWKGAVDDMAEVIEPWVPGKGVVLGWHSALDGKGHLSPAFKGGDYDVFSFELPIADPYPRMNLCRHLMNSDDDDDDYWIAPDCDVHVDCDQNCMALTEPSTIEELEAAVTHWRSHGWLSGCSHGR